MKNKTTALLLSIFLGGLGIDRFYLGYTGMGILKLLTAGCCGVLYIIDIVFIATGKLTPADGSEYEDEIGNATMKAKEVANSLDNIEKIAQLHKDGVISDVEFEKIKKEIMEEI